MSTIDLIIQISYVLVGVLIFCSGFLLVFKNLKKVNTIEGEKFNFPDWLAMVGFGGLFAASLVFMLDITMELISAQKNINFSFEIPSIGGIILTGMIIVLIIYPLWEVIFLGRPTSDSVHDFHKFLESKILDKFRGNIAYLISLLIFIVIYIIPVVLLSIILDKDIIQVGLMWFLLFPLLFLQYFAANGTASGVIKKTYQTRIPKDVLNNSIVGQSKMKKIMNIVLLLIAWIPFLLNGYNVIMPFYNGLILGQDIISQKSGAAAIFSLITTVPFGIKGFFKKFWNRKSKTKTIDFLFAGYIFIGIGVSMLISFMKLSPDVVGAVLQGNFLLDELGLLFADESLLLPIIVIQSFITFAYGLIVIAQPNTDFYADIKVQATTGAFGKLDIYNLIKERQKQLQKIQDGEEVKGKKKEAKKEKI